MDIKIIGENWQIIISFGVALVSLLLGIRANAKRSLLPETKEEQLSKQVEDLRKTVNTLVTELDLARKRIQELETQLTVARERINVLESSQIAATDKNSTILVGINSKESDASIAAMRAIREKGCFAPTFMRPVQFKRMKSLLDTRRATGIPIRYVYLLLEVSGNRLIFKDGEYTPTDLDGILTDVDVLVLIGRDTSFAAALIGSVPYVITVRGAVPEEAIALFIRIFWTAIGDGSDPNDAFYLAVERSPTVIMDVIELHT